MCHEMGVIMYKEDAWSQAEFWFLEALKSPAAQSSEGAALPRCREVNGTRVRSVLMQSTAAESEARACASFAPVSLGHVCTMQHPQQNWLPGSKRWSQGYDQYSQG